MHINRWNTQVSAHLRVALQQQGVEGLKHLRCQLHPGGRRLARHKAPAASKRHLPTGSSRHSAGGLQGAGELVGGDELL
jgi:hypothetical protein